MRWARLAILSTLSVVIFSCQKQVSPEETQAVLAAQNSSSALIDSLIAADSVDSSGIDYIDNVYDLTLGTDSATKAYPVYHSLLTTDLPCEITDTLQMGCLFDETDIDGNGTVDIGGANRRKLVVNRKNGVIDLAASFTAGVFGTNPLNGARRTFTFFYRLDDNSRRSLDHVTIQLIHYKRVTDVPEILVNEIAARKQQYLVSTSSSLTTALTAYATIYKPKRPPLIVIVSGL